MNKEDLKYNFDARTEAVNAAKAAYDVYNSQGKVRKPGLITVVNMREPSYRKRLYVYSLNSGVFLRNHHVAHGVGSNSDKSKAYADKFSNVPNSKKSSLGAMVTAETYFGSHGLSLKLDGLEPGKNDNVRKRYIVVHSAPYMTDRFILSNGRAGNSWGCPALDPSVYKDVIDLIKGGTFFYIYY